MMAHVYNYALVQLIARGYIQLTQIYTIEAVAR